MNPQSKLEDKDGPDEGNQDAVQLARRETSMPHRTRTKNNTRDRQSASRKPTK